ncbi:NAD(P)/FAD-dependent oxidoreductase [Ensifer sp. YR511]|uniref:FAD-dependent oxidoreductase n=1 Tax=Ensifer sp. YR511 TaxID=1855294 RepID=UPI00088909E0|nr:NAD(P)/FAD-dependent oxidoreductase [Ensifer sp. YR511]SDN35938.1 2-polyprenyl-6-methoxyphenol hydroxylase [Ensifer sp. YR511]
MLQHPTVAIIGAGPAGLTVASILQQHDWQIAIFDAEPSARARDQGGTLDLHAGTGQLALEKAGLLADFRKIARHEDQDSRVLDYRSAMVLAEDLPAPGEGQRPEIDRRALRELLLSSLAADSVCWGHRLEKVTNEGSGKHRLNFENGKSESFDLVIGADGAWSRVRPALTDVQPVYTGTTFVELWIDEIDVRHPALARMVGRGTMFAVHAGLGLVAQRNGGGHVRVYAAIPVSPDETQRPDVALAGMTKGGLLKRFEGWSDTLLGLISDAYAIAAIRPIVALPPGLRWTYRPGLTLVGDAAHVMPPVGVGVNLAMLDAANLAECLVYAPDWLMAVQQYETIMLNRAARAADQAAAGFADLFSADAPAGMLDHMHRRRA